MTVPSVVLVVDDEPRNRRLLIETLRPAGYELREAQDGLGAIDARFVRPDLVLLDVMMPEMDGFETCRRFRADPALREVPIILVTALDDRESRLTGIEAGADDFLSKPVDLTELRARVRTICRLNRARALHEERARLDELTALSPNAVVVIDENADVAYANALAEPIIADPMVLELIIPIAVKARGGSRVQESITVSQDATVREYDVAAAPVPWKGMSAAQVVLTDITAQRAWERAATEQRRLESLGRFASSVAHEFASVMTVIDMSAEMMMGSQDEALYTMLLGEMRHAIQRGAILTRDILSFGRPQPSTAAPHDARVTLTDTARLLERLLPKSIRLSTEFTEMILPVGMSRERLEQVLVNLCFNARDAMPRGGSLLIRAQGDGDWVTIEIVDSGTGMDEATRKRVFEPFFTTKAPGAGTGLGLWIVGALLDSVGGSVEIESTVEVGTTVRVRLPYLQLFTPPSVAASQLGPRGDGQRIAISIADDAVAKALAGLLAGFGYVVVPTNEPHDLLIADVTLSVETMASRAAAAGGRLLVLGTGGPEPSASLRVEHIAEPIRGKALLEAMERLFTPAD
jgi:two-component system cell cycle sensor histidine kinase/response regulator CckA